MRAGPERGGARSDARGRGRAHLDDKVDELVLVHLLGVKVGDEKADIVALGGEGRGRGKRATRPGQRQGRVSAKNAAAKNAAEPRRAAAPIHPPPRACGAAQKSFLRASS